MQILINDGFDEEYRSELSVKQQELVEAISREDPNLVIYKTDIGMGADWPMLLVEFFKDFDLLKTAVCSTPLIFFLGEKVNKNLDAWIEIGKKLAKIFRSCKPTRIDHNVASLVVLKDCDEVLKGKNIENISVVVHPQHEVGHNSRGIDRFPDSLYTVVICTQDVVVICIIDSEGVIQNKVIQKMGGGLVTIKQ